MRLILNKPLISSRRPNGVSISTRLGRIIAHLDQASVVYQLPVAGEAGSTVSGTGNLRTEKRGDQLHCRVAGDVFRSDPFAIAFHSFWLTRRGMILLVAGLAANQSEAAFYIRTKGSIDLALKADARRWLRQQIAAGL
jgi:hypothetical protein